jgi:O-antigen/teichoic acid export membrane protein
VAVSGKAVRHASGSSTVSTAAGIFVVSTSQYLAAFAATALLSRALGPEGRGVYYGPILAAVTVLSFCKLGIDQVNVYLLGSRSLPISRISAQNGFVSLWAGVIGCAVTVALHWLLPSLFGTTSILFLLIAGLTIPFGIHTQLSAGLLSLAGRAKWQYRAGLTGALVQALLIAVLMALGYATPGPALVTTLVSGIVTWRVMVWPFSKVEGGWYGADRFLLKDTLRHAVVLHLGMLLLFLHLRFDLFMVKAWLGTAALGQYSLTVTLGETLPLATESVALAILPGQVVNSLKDASARALRASRATIAFGLIIALAWIVLGAPMIRLVFGADFLPAYTALLVLLPGVVLMGVQRVCGAPALRTGRPAVIAAIYGLSLCCNVLLNVAWIPRWGLIGASAASTVSYSLSTLLFVAWTARLAEVSVVRALVPDRQDLDLFVAGVRRLCTCLRHADSSGWRLD